MLSVEIGLLEEEKDKKNGAIDLHLKME